MLLRSIFLALLVVLNLVPPAQAQWGSGLGFNIKPAPTNAPYVITTSDSRLPNATVLDVSGVGDLTSFDVTNNASSLLTFTGVPDTSGAVVLTVGLATGQTANRAVITNGSGAVGLGQIDLSTAIVTGSLPQANVASLVSDLAGKAATVHTHAQADVTDLVTDLGNKQALDADLTAISALTGTGLLARTGAGTYAERSIASSGSTITITNPGGVAGDINLEVGNHSAALLTSGTVDSARLDATLTALAGLDSTAGYLVQTGADTFVRRSMASADSSITITNPAGTAGNTDFAVGNHSAAKLTSGTVDNARLDTQLSELAALSVSAGDIFTVNDSGAIVRLAGGSDDQVLTYDSTQNPNVKWADAEGGGDPQAWLASLANHVKNERGYLIDGCAGTAYIAFGTTSGAAVSGTASAVTSADGQFISCAAAASTNSDAGGNSAAVLVRRAALPIWWTRFKTGSSIATQRFWMGVSSVTNLNTIDTPTTQHVAAIRYAPAVDGTAFFRFVTCDGASNVTTTTTTQSIATDTRYDAIIDMSESGHVKLWMSASGAAFSLVADHTTNLPGDTTSMGWEGRMRTLENVAKTILVGPVRVVGN